MASVSDAIDELKTICRAMPELESVNLPTSEGEDYPFAVVAVESGEFVNLTLGGNRLLNRHTFAVEIHYPFEQIDENINEAIGSVESFMDALREHGLVGREKIFSKIELISYTFGGLPKYGEVGTYGPAFSITGVLESR